MGIKTKSDVGDFVWVMEQNKAIEKKVGTISIQIFTDGKGECIKVIKYLFRKCNKVKNETCGWDEFYERDVFATKKELLESL